MSEWYRVMKIGPNWRNDQAPAERGSRCGLRAVLVFSAVGLVLFLSGCQRNSFDYGGIPPKNDAPKYTVEGDPNGPARAVAAPDEAASTSPMP